MTTTTGVTETMTTEAPPAAAPTAAAVPEGFAAHESFGDATDQVKSVAQADPDTITVTWKGPDGELRAADHRQEDGRIAVE
ncbi:hypothetical protein CJ204_03955 [Corynebacterium xerosis]|uniref:Uncharacterized protein n=1 Tax=Corynebacterium xerosis TaxID=1725 RepID=A0A2N6T0I4_9CORY|nr:hypothetical protein [Corynebacterium xerosis]PMC62826.1 hypothetical protein CJ204_03955 [Corynebacterium xerosis]